LTTLLSGGGTRGRESLDDDVDLSRDRELVTRAQAGDRSAFDDLYLRYSRRLYRFCLRRLHDPHEAEDVAQEAFARAWRALPSFGGDRRFYPWLSVIAAHLCTDVLRRRNRSTPVAEFHQGNVASTEDSGEEIAMAAVDSAIVAKAFTRLSDRHQRILHLREGSGWSYQKIADHEGVGITAVETLLWRARQALKREFASIAGAEGRMAGLLGSVVSLSALRRMFRRAALRAAMSTPRTAALATMGSAAATALVMTAVLSAPVSQAPTQSPGSTPSSITPAASGLGPAAGPAAGTAPSPGPGTASGTAGGTGTGTGGSSAGATSSTPGGGTLSGLLPGGAGGLGGSVSGVTGTLGSTVSGLGSTVSGLGSSVSGVVGGVPVVGGTVAGIVSGATATLGSTVSGVGSTLAGTGSGSSGASSSNPLSGVTHLLGGL